MKKELKDFGKLVSLVMAIYFIEQLAIHYLTIDFSIGRAWIGLIFFAFVLYSSSK